MVILGGLEIVAVGYVIHKHAQNKKEKLRIEEEREEREEREYRRQHRSHSRRRHSRERRHSYDNGKHDYRRESPRPPMPAMPVIRPAMKPAVQQQIPPQSMAQQMRPPPPYASVPTASSQPQQDIKYGWTDEPAQQQPPQHDPSFPPTGWPAHWAQSQTPSSSSTHLAPNSHSRRGEGRASSASPHVRFAEPRKGARSPSISPPPSYRA